MHPDHDHSESTVASDHTETEESAEQAIQINENTIADPKPPEPMQAEELHGRTDFPINPDQGMQINDNSVGHKKDS